MSCGCEFGGKTGFGFLPFFIFFYYFFGLTYLLRLRMRMRMRDKVGMRRVFGPLGHLWWVCVGEGRERVALVITISSSKFLERAQRLG